MSNLWSTIKFSEINPNPEIIPEGEYVFSVSGAKFNDMDGNKVDVNATIVTEGDFTGRKMFFSYPNPSIKEWSPKALKRLEMALGTDAGDEESPVEYLNRVAGSHFRAKVSHSKATEEYPNPRANLNIFSVAAAA